MKYLKTLSCWIFATLFISLTSDIQAQWSQATQGVSTLVPLSNPGAPVTEFQIYEDNGNLSYDPILTLNWGAYPALSGSSWGALAELRNANTVYSTLSTTGSLVLHSDGLTQGGDLILTTYHPATAPANGYPTYIQDNGGAIRFATHQDNLTPAGGDLDQERMKILSNGNVGIGVSRPQSILQLPNYFTFGASSGNPQAGPSTAYIGCNWAEGWEVQGGSYLDCVGLGGQQYGFMDRYIDLTGGDSASRIQFRRGEIDLQTIQGIWTAEGACGPDPTAMTTFAPPYGDNYLVRFYSGCMQVGMPPGDENHPGASNTLEVNGGGLIGSDWVGGVTNTGHPISPKAPVNGLMVEGAVEIGTDTSLNTTVTPHIRPTPDGNTYMLVVNGSELAKEVIVRTDFTPDFVFLPDYKLTSLPNLSDTIQKLGHLPGIPCAAKMSEEGVEVGRMEMQLLQKVEELTRYAIDSDKKIAELTKRVQELESKEK